MRRSIIAIAISDSGRPGFAPGNTRSPAFTSFGFSNPAVTAPIVGVTKPEHLADAIAAVDLELSDEDIAALEEPYQPHPIAGHV
jgi:aryl-alcohol dehydrogenase (NADP+)